MNLPERWAAILNDLRAQGRYRALSPPRGIDFSSNDYLGYAGGRRQVSDNGWHGQLAARATPTLSDSGWHGQLAARGIPAPDPAASLPLTRSGMASRLLRGHHPLWDEVENALARWHGAPAVLMMTSGYAANEGLLATVIEPHDWVASDALNHASIIDGLRLAQAERFIYRHADLDHLETGLRAAAAKRSAKRQLFVVTESLFGMEGDLVPLSQLVQVAERYDAQVLVDEAHSTGCFGPNGSGCVDAAGLRSRVLATVHTGGKALGVAGAYVCGSAMLRELLVNRCRHFVFTTALPPVVAAWWQEVLPRVIADHAGRTALHERGSLFRTELEGRGVASGGGHYIVPVVLGSDDRAVQAASRLREAGFDIRAIRPPTVHAGTARLRISIHADHAPDTLAAAASAVAEVLSSTPSSAK